MSKHLYWDKPIAVEFSRFRVLPGKSERVDEWMKYLRDHLPECLISLEGEKMYVETIFREKCADGQEFLCWYSIQGEGGVRVDQSSHEIDKVHLKFWRECIDPSHRRTDLTTEVVMVPERFQKLMS